MKRVVITGLGPVTSIGSGKEEFTNALRSGKSGVSEITRFDTSKYDVHYAGEVKDFDLRKFCPDVEEKEIKRLALFTQYALAASELAIKDSGIIVGKNVDDDEVTVRMGVGVGGLREIELDHTVLEQKGPRRVSPLLVTKIISDASASSISLRHKIRGEAISVNSACSSSLSAISDGFDKIRIGDYSVALVGGAEACITPLTLAAFSRMGALSKRGISSPYDKNRDGFVLSEGSGILVLEELKHALRRNARIYAEVLGYGATSDAYHEVAPDPNGEGLILAIDKAMSQAGIHYVDYINTHGTSTEQNDRIETKAIQSEFGRLTKIPVSSTKSMTGHAMGAAGGIELIATILGMENGFIPPTINYETKDPECDLDYVVNEAREKQIDTALKLSLGFGGHNHAIVLEKYRE